MGTLAWPAIDFLIFQYEGFRPDGQGDQSD
jgi:hypothetical protein